jgi:hypothetical protein
MTASRSTFRSPVPGRVFRWWLAACVLVMLVVVACFAAGMVATHAAPLHITIGDDIDDVVITGGTETAKDLLAIAGVTAGLLVVMMLPVLLVLLFAVLTVVLAIGIVVPLLVAALAVGAVTSPAWLILAAIWLARRRRRSHAAAASATMPA